MKSIIIFVAITTAFISGCKSDGFNIGAGKTSVKPAVSVSERTKNHYKWEAGQEIERVGKIWLSKSIGGNRYHIRCDDRRNPQLVSSKLDQLKLPQGTPIWVKGNIEYKHYERPKSSSDPSCFVFPQTICFLNVTDFRTIEDSSLETGAIN